MKEHPTIFSAPMVRALLAGQKTQTRRIVKPSRGSCILGGPSKRAIDWQQADYFERFGNDGGMTDWWSAMRGSPLGAKLCIAHLLCPYGVVGDRLWVKENYRFIEHGQFGAIKYEADRTIMPMPPAPCWDDDPHAWWSNGFDKHGDKLRPSIFLPKWAPRIHLEITEVRVERLQDISEQDAIAEGVTLDLIQALMEPAAKKIKTGFVHWILGDDSSASYCYPCATELTKGDEDKIDGGWDSPSDTPEFCEKCKVRLDNSLTDYAAETCATDFDEYGLDDPLTVLEIIREHPQHAPKLIRPGYRYLFESINGKGSWKANPWVWVIEFKRAQA